jgi:hypothetical protein
MENATGALPLAECRAERIKEEIRATNAKEVGVKNPAEETFRHPDQKSSKKLSKPFAVIAFLLSKSSAGHSEAAPALEYKLRVLTGRGFTGFHGELEHNSR